MFQRNTHACARTHTHSYTANLSSRKDLSDWCFLGVLRVEPFPQPHVKSGKLSQWVNSLRWEGRCHWSPSSLVRLAGRSHEMDLLGRQCLIYLPDVKKARVPMVSLDMMLWKRASCPNICRPASFSRRASGLRLSHSPWSFSICWIFILLKYYRKQRGHRSEKKD